MVKKRDKLAMIQAILGVIERTPDAKFTHIQYGANTSHEVLTTYLDELMSKGFVAINGTEGKRTYLLTEKGKKYLADYAVLKSFADSYGIGG